MLIPPTTTCHVQHARARLVRSSTHQPVFSSARQKQDISNSTKPAADTHPFPYSAHMLVCQPASPPTILFSRQTIPQFDRHGRRPHLRICPSDSCTALPKQQASKLPERRACFHFIRRATSATDRQAERDRRGHGGCFCGGVRFRQNSDLCRGYGSGWAYIDGYPAGETGEGNGLCCWPVGRTRECSWYHNLALTYGNPHPTQATQVSIPLTPPKQTPFRL